MTFYRQRLPYSSFENNTRQTDRRTDGPTDRRTNMRSRIKNIFNQWGLRAPTWLVTTKYDHDYLLSFPGGCVLVPIQCRVKERSLKLLTLICESCQNVKKYHSNNCNHNKISEKNKRKQVKLFVSKI